MMKIVPLLLLMLPGIALGQSIPTHPAGQFAELNTVSDQTDSRLSVTVLNGSYILAWKDIHPRWATTGAEKLYVLRFRVRNDGQQIQKIDPARLKVTVTDSANRSFDEPLAFRIPNTTKSASASLVQSQVLSVAAAFNIPADADIVSAQIADTRRDGGPGVRFDVHSNPELPRELSPNGAFIGPIVSASVGTWYPLGVTDVRVESVSLATEQILNFAPDETTDIAVVDLSVRNRSNKDVRMHRGLYRETSVSSSDGDRKLLGLLFRDSDKNSDFPLLPHSTVNLRALFKVPKGTDISSIDFVERIGPRGGALSRRYRVATGPASNTGQAQADTWTAPDYSAGGIAGSRPQTSLPSSGNTGTDGNNGQARTGGPVVERAPIPGVTGDGPPATVPSVSTPPVSPAEVPDGLLPSEEYATSVAADPMLLPVQTVTLPEVEFPDIRYVANLDRYRVVHNQESSGDEPWLAVIKFQGRQADRNNPPPIYFPRRDRNFLGGVDWATGGTSRSLAGNKIQVRKFEPARPFETHVYVVLGFEGDNSSDAERERVAAHVRSRIASVWTNYANRNLGIDYDDLTVVNRDRALNLLKPEVERLYSDIYSAARAAARSFNWSSGDTDEFYGVGIQIWLHAGEGATFANYGITDSTSLLPGPPGWTAPPVAGAYSFRFSVNPGHTLPLTIEPAPGRRQVLDYDILVDALD